MSNFSYTHKIGVQMDFLKQNKRRYIRGFINVCSKIAYFIFRKTKTRFQYHVWNRCGDLSFGNLKMTSLL